MVIPGFMRISFQCSFLILTIHCSVSFWTFPNSLALHNIRHNEHNESKPDRAISMPFQALPIPQHQLGKRWWSEPGLFTFLLFSRHSVFNNCKTNQKWRKRNPPKTGALTTNERRCLEGDEPDRMMMGKTKARCRFWGRTVELIGATFWGRSKSRAALEWSTGFVHQWIAFAAWLGPGMNGTQSA